jgi:hypothetical protein
LSELEVDQLAAAFDKIPWRSFGRKNKISRLAESLLPIGNFPARLPSRENEILLASDNPDFEKGIMDIKGTAMQCGRGKLLTCWHVCQELAVPEGRSYVQTKFLAERAIYKIYWPLTVQFSFIDPRTKAGNADVDIGLIGCPAKSTSERPYEVPVIKWGDSTTLGVGDRVLIGGYPLGRDMFLAAATNRAIVQPTFYDGIISAILPAVRPSETRLLQISSVALGGISGGAVCRPDTGEVVGMVTSGLTSEGVSLPITYAIPSEVLQPYANSISFKTEGGEIWK